MLSHYSKFQYFAHISSKNRIWKKNRVKCIDWRYTGHDYQKITFPTPPDIGAYGGCVTEGDGDGEGVGDGDGHSIYLRTLINQTLGLSADLRGRTNPEGVRQSSADSELRRGFITRGPKKRGVGANCFTPKTKVWGWLRGTPYLCIYQRKY